MSSTFLIGSAHAEDWTGYYVGPELGVAFNQADLDSNQLGFTNQNGTCNENSHFANFYPGLHIGYLHVFNSKLVLGAEGNFSYNINKDKTLECDCPTNANVTDKFSLKNRYQASLRGRIGYAMNVGLLPFLTLGGSIADLRLNYKNEGGDHYSTNSTKTAWLIGAGLAWPISDAWSIGLEYFYSDYSTLKMKIPSIYGLLDANGGANLRLSTNNIELSINYWFWD